jgi:hypothetical protein
MSTTHNLGLPASECAKLVPARPAQEHATGEDIVRATAIDAAVPAPVERARPTAHHLSGFARA